MDGLNLNTLIGPGEVGAFIATVLFGCAVVQVYMYYEEFQNDHWGLKMLVSIGHMVSLIAAVYIMTVTNYGEPQTLAILPHACYLSAIFSPLVALGAQVICFWLRSLARSKPLEVLTYYPLGLLRVPSSQIVSLPNHSSFLFRPRNSSRGLGHHR
ncbi:hypothetical protein HYDPIDRAFT_87702 [Hydnomerulius pinastri MD-312]|nr:hypothetical protein HYDPIDRAFT_87702 [Hydnomerulius pinastri MD-312]